MNKSRTRIRDIIDHIEPFDVREQGDLQDVLDWIDSSEELFRRQSPDVPKKHLVAYVVVVDGPRKSVLLMEHTKSGLWLPTGGHVEPDEDPYQTAVRELGEELGYKAAQVGSVASLPLFVTVNQTLGMGRHTDVSLWYVVSGDERMWLDPDPEEFGGHRWWKFDEILAVDINQFDVNMHRFMRKLETKVRLL